jgi:hypothetical protein
MFAVDKECLVQTRWEGRWEGQGDTFHRFWSGNLGRYLLGNLSDGGCCCVIVVAKK